MNYGSPKRYFTPVITTFLVLCVLVEILSLLTNQAILLRLFCVYKPEQWDFYAVFRLFGHVLGHADWGHLLSNAIPLFLIGPDIEKRYGSGMVILLILVTALVTGLFSILVFPDNYLLGASGVVFAVWAFTAVTGVNRHTLSNFSIVVIVLYMAEEVIRGVALNDGIAHYAHVVGAVVGIGAGLILKDRNLPENGEPFDGYPPEGSGNNL